MELRKAHRSPHSRARRLAAAAAICAAALWLAPTSAFAQLDPLLFLQRSQPNVIIAVDVANRMQYDGHGTYYDPYDYTETAAAWEALLGVAPGATRYRRAYKSLVELPPFSSDMYTAARIDTLDNTDALFSAFWSRTRLAVARAGLMAAVQQNARVARFGLVKMRQLNPRIGDRANEGPVWVKDASQIGPTPSGAMDGRWRITTTVVDAPNGSVGTAAAPVVAANSAGASASVATILSRAVNQPGGLLPAGQDTDTEVDAPVRQAD